MDPDDLDGLARHWVKSPPPHLAAKRLYNLVLTYLGGTPDGEEEPLEEVTEQDLEGLVAAANQPTGLSR